MPVDLPPEEIDTVVLALEIAVQEAMETGVSRSSAEGRCCVHCAGKFSAVANRLRTLMENTDG